MKKIPLLNRKNEIVDYALVDDEVFDELSKRKWYYVKPGYGGCYLALHTEAAKQYKIYEEGKEIDHINRNGLDNTKKNLRSATHKQNCANRRLMSNNTTGYRGVYYVPKINASRPWMARISNSQTENFQYTHLGYFLTKDGAAAAYDKIAIKQYGEFASPNFKTDEERNKAKMGEKKLSINNKRKNNKSIYRGVIKYNSKINPWAAIIHVNKKQVFLGAFSTELKASKEHEKARKKYGK